MVEYRFLVPQDVRTVLQQFFWLLIYTIFHTVPESVLRETDCLHIFAPVRVPMTFFVKYHIQVELSGGDVDLIIPKIEGDKWQSKPSFKIIYNISFKIFHLQTDIIVFLLADQLHQISLDSHYTDESWHNSTIALMHEGNIVDIFSVLPHHFHDSTEVYLFFNHVVMLVDHHVFGLGVLLHNQFDIFCESVAELSLYDGVLLFVVVLGMESQLVLVVVIHAILRDDA